MAKAGGYLWTFNFETGSVLRIAPNNREVTEIESVSEPVSIASNGDWVWLADNGPAEISRSIRPTGTSSIAPNGGFLTATRTRCGRWTCRR